MRREVARSGYTVWSSIQMVLVVHSGRRLGRWFPLLVGFGAHTSNSAIENENYE